MMKQWMRLLLAAALLVATVSDETFFFFLPLSPTCNITTQAHLYHTLIFFFPSLIQQLARGG